MKVQFHGSEEVAKNIKTFWFKPKSPIRFIAGQFIELYLPHDRPDSRGEKRWFTLSSSPKDVMVSVTVKLNPASSTFKKTLQALEPGAELDMASPMGDFILPKDRSIPLLFVAGGVGCTPFHSIIKYLHDTGEKRDITLIYAANSKEELAFVPEFEKLNDRFITLIDEPLTAQKILKIAGDDAGQYIYLSGPEPLVEVLDKDLKAKGIDPQHLRTDFFPGYSSI